MHEPAVFAVADEEKRLFKTGVHEEAVAGLKLAVARAFAAEAFEVFASGVEFVDERFSVAVGDEDVAIRRDGDGRGLVVLHAVRVAGGGLLGEGDLQDGGAV